MSPFFPVWLYS